MLGRGGSVRKCVVLGIIGKCCIETGMEVVLQRGSILHRWKKREMGWAGYVASGNRRKEVITKGKSSQMSKVSNIYIYISSTVLL